MKAFMVQVVSFAVLIMASMATTPFTPEKSWASLFMDKSVADIQEEARDTTSTGTNEAILGYFLRSYNSSLFQTIQRVDLSANDAAALKNAGLDGMVHYRLIPGTFPKNMGYHFDGLAAVMKFTFKLTDKEGMNNGPHIEYLVKAYESEAYTDYNKCVFFGTGTGPKLGTHICFTNPGVNLLPIENQLWLTIDTSSWGRVDMDTLATVKAKVKVPSLVLNAHPACDRKTRECFVQYPCGKADNPYSNLACIGILLPGETDMGVQQLSKTTLPVKKLIQHSHSPCVTPGFVVSKLDAFTKRPDGGKGKSGLLHYLHQQEDNMWLVMDRTTNQSTVVYSDSNMKFVNNHFWNCYEEDGAVIIDTVTTTGDYLDNYFLANLSASTPNWSEIFHPSLRCKLPVSNGVQNVTCEHLMAKTKSKGSYVTTTGAEDVFFDYPTFNPLQKMKVYKYFYAIAATSKSRWFDTLVKVDVSSGSGVIVGKWSAPNVYLTEFDFSPSGDEGEDSGTLIGIMYNSTSDTSSLGIFDAHSMQLSGLYPLSSVVPFHAHGIICLPGQPCFSNP